MTNSTSPKFFCRKIDNHGNFIEKDNNEFKRNHFFSPDFCKNIDIQRFVAELYANSTRKITNSRNAFFG